MEMDQSTSLIIFRQVSLTTLRHELSFNYSLASDTLGKPINEIFPLFREVKSSFKSEVTKRWRAGPVEVQECIFYNSAGKAFYRVSAALFVKNKGAEKLFKSLDRIEDWLQSL